MKNLILLIGLLALTVACNIGVAAPRIESTPSAALPASRTPVPAATTPTDTPLPALPPLYFTDEFDVPATFWQFFQTGGANSPLSAIENGLLRIDISSPDTWVIGIHSARTYSNIFIRAKISASAPGSVGLICRYNESDGWFEFSLASDGSYSVLFGQWLAAGIAKYYPIATDGSKELNSGNVNYEIGLSCQENVLNLYVGDTLLRRLDVANYGLASGNIGLAAASFQQTPMSAFFEWVKVNRE